MAVSPFFIVTRTLPCGTKRFITRFLNPDGTVMRSTTLQDPRIHTKSQAVREADRLLKGGIVPRAEDPFLYDYLMDFWQPESDYVKAKARRKQALSDQYITMAVRWHARQNKLPDPFFGFEKLPETPHKRGVITTKQLGALLKLDGYEPRARAAVYLGILCGLRQGEIVGLQWNDIDLKEGVINVCHNIPSKTKKLVQPKWDSERTVPLPTIISDILNTIQGMPKASPNFVIYNLRSKIKPVTEVYLRKVLKRMLSDIGVSSEIQVSKNCERMLMLPERVGGGLEYIGGIVEELQKRSKGKGH